MSAPETNVQTPGRTCPLHYRYAPTVFNRPAMPDLSDLQVLYVVGGLYGNEPALLEVLRLFAQERGRKRLVFNGDFHWFDVDPQRFARVQQAVLEHTAMRGNVETELANASDNGAAGCGCAYPAWVDEGTVERSNHILERLRSATSSALRTQLGVLPMWLRASVGKMQIAIVHGDAQSLAGWGFAQESLHQPEQQALVQSWFVQAQVDAFACSHTCLPVFQRLSAKQKGVQDNSCWVFNNGAAGMPNFHADTAGLLTRIASTPFTGRQRRFGMCIHRFHNDIVYADAIAIEADPQQVQQQFLAQWPQGSPAHTSYYQRIVHGPSYTLEQALCLEKESC